MNGAAAAVIGIVAIITALGLLSSEKLVEWDESITLDSLDASYAFAQIQSPRLAGVGLRILGIALNTPIIGPFLVSIFLKQNKVPEVRTFAAALPLEYSPLYYPNTTVSESVKKEHAAWAEEYNLANFTKSLSSSRKSGSGFQYWKFRDFTERYEKGTLTPTDVAKTLIRLVRSSNDTLKAWADFHEEELLAQAAASTKRYKAGKPLGPLDGVPLAVKDEVDMKGFITTFGTSFIKTVAKEDAEAVARLRRAGALLPGKTNMHEIGLGTSGSNLHFGTPRNAHGENRFSGGSSSGSAAVVAVGLVPGAIGCDGGGSIRIPSALCGVVGIKGTFGRVPHPPGFCYSVCHVGPIAATVEDVSILYSVISGPSYTDLLSVAQPTAHLKDVGHLKSLKGVRVGIYRPHFDDSSPDVRAVVDKALKALISKGAKLVDITIPHLEIISKSHTLTIAGEVATYLERYFRHHMQDFSPEIQVAMGFAKGLSTRDFISAQQVRAYATRVMKGIFEQVDVIVTPTTATTAPIAPPDIHTSGESDLKRTSSLMRYVFLANFVGHPGITIPVGFDENKLPIGMQLEAGFWNEHILLSIAQFAEESSLVARRKPEYYFDLLEEASSKK